jgi:hypothetical protein
MGFDSIEMIVISHLFIPGMYEECKNLRRVTVVSCIKDDRRHKSTTKDGEYSLKCLILEVCRGKSRSIQSTLVIDDIALYYYGILLFLPPTTIRLSIVLAG